MRNSKDKPLNLIQKELSVYALSKHTKYLLVDYHGLEKPFGLERGAGPRAVEKFKKRLNSIPEGTEMGVLMLDDDCKVVFERNYIRNSNILPE